MNKFPYITALVLSALLALTATTHATANNSLPAHRHIAVTGKAEISAKPDIALLQLHVESTLPTSLAAKNDVDKRVNQLLKGLERFDVDKSNVSASSINTQPNYSYGKNNRREVTGYSARRDLTVSLNDISKLNEFMDFALKVKINEIRNIQLKSSQAEALKAQAMSLAVKHAQAQGQIMAESFGAKLGKIYSINSHNQQSQYRYGANRDVEMVRMADAKASSEPGQYLQETINFSASINVVFDLDVD